MNIKHYRFIENRISNHVLKLFMIGLLMIISSSCHQFPREIDTSYQILVDFSLFDSVEEAAHAEALIDWNAISDANMNACTESFAALELQKFLRNLTKNTCDMNESFEINCLTNSRVSKSIVIANLSSKKIRPFVDKKKLNLKLFQAESFAIVPDDDVLFIIGYDRVGTLYGVYHFLQMLGCRWYAPGEIGCIITEVKSIKIPADIIIEEPKFFTRGFWAWEDRGSEEFYLWMARNRLNFWTVAEPNHSLLRKLGIQLSAGGHEIFNRFLNPNDDYPYNHPLFEEDESKPEDPYKSDSKEYQGDKNKDGQLTYFEAHPEWYGFIRVMRRAFEGNFGANICTSNQDAVNELCNKLTNDLAYGEWRDANMLNFWPLDGGKWCECENCQTLGTPTDRLLLLIHQVRSTIVRAMSEGKINRNVKVIFPIYNETFSPPTRPLPADFDYENCIGTIFPLRRCYGHYLEDPLCTEYNTEIWDRFLGWTKRKPGYYQGQLFIGEYYNVSSIRSLPVLYTRIMEHDLPLYYQHGARHCHYMHVSTQLLGPKRVNNYLYAKLLWNPAAHKNVILDEYFKKFYGDAGQEMKIVYRKLEYALANIKQLKHATPLTTRINKNESPLFDHEHLQLKETHPDTNDGVDLEESVVALAECRSIMNDLLSQKWDGYVKDRLWEDDKNLKYAENTVTLYYYVAQAIIAKRSESLEEAKKFYAMCIPFAKALEEEVEIVQTSSSHANANNGLEASLIMDAYHKLGKDLGFNIN